MSEQTTELCCPPFDPEPWDSKHITWHNKKFIKDRVRSFLHIPLNFSTVMRRNMSRILAADAAQEKTVVLTEENSLWGADVYIDVSKDVPDAEMTTLSGDFYSRVFEGPYRDCRKWMREFMAEVNTKGRRIRRVFCYYTTCPRCAKAYGKNYVVLLGELE